MYSDSLSCPQRGQDLACLTGRMFEWGVLSARLHDCFADGLTRLLSLSTMVPCFPFERTACASQHSASSPKAVDGRKILYSWFLVFSDTPSTVVGGCQMASFLKERPQLGQRVAFNRFWARTRCVWLPGFELYRWQPSPNFE